MDNNEILRRIRYAFDYSDVKMTEIFGLADYTATKEQIIHWLKQEGDPEFQSLKDSQLAVFLNGLISFRRGKKEGVPPEPEQRLNNNIILRKLKIALDLKAENVLEILSLADVTISNHELSALFRKPGHKHYRECMDQMLRNFLNGMKLKYRDNVHLSKE